MHHDLTRNTLAVFCIVGLIALSLWVLRPFLAATVWSTMLVVATWPWLISLQKTFGGRRAPAVLVMTVGMLLLLVAPLWWAISTITQKSDQFMVLGKSLASNGLPALPDWVEHIPFIGEKINTAWTDLIAGGAAGFMDHVAPYAASTGKWVLSQFGGLGGMLIQFLLVVTISAILYSAGEDAAKMIRSFGRRLAGCSTRALSHSSCLVGAPSCSVLPARSPQSVGPCPYRHSPSAARALRTPPALQPPPGRRS